MCHRKLVNFLLLLLLFVRLTNACFVFKFNGLLGSPPLHFKMGSLALAVAGTCGREKSKTELIFSCWHKLNILSFNRSQWRRVQRQSESPASPSLTDLSNGVNEKMAIILLPRLSRSRPDRLFSCVCTGETEQKIPSCTHAASDWMSSICRQLLNREILPY